MTNPKLPLAPKNPKIFNEFPLLNIFSSFGGEGRRNPPPPPKSEKFL